LTSNNGPGADGAAETFLDYSWVLYTNNDIEADCSASSGILSQTQTAFYPAVTEGASRAACTVAIDYLSSQGISKAGTWRFASENNQVAATYKDVSQPSADAQYVFTEDDCAVYQMDDDLMWTAVPLSKLTAKLAN
jgi:hypothetical protein